MIFRSQRSTTGSSLRGSPSSNTRRLAARFSALVILGASAKQVQVWAGHRSVATVFGRYGHLFAGGEDPVMDSLD